MEDLIGIEFVDKKYEDGAVITWGKIFKETELLEIIKDGLHRRFGAKEIESIKLCNSLVQIADHPYFYECLIRFIQEPIPSGKNKYKKWVKAKRQDLQNVYDVAFTGFKSHYQDYLERKAQGFPEDE